jgi:protein TonB
MMFEKVTRGRAGRRTVLQLNGISASMAAHAVCVLGLAALSLGAAAETPVETATYLLLQAPPALPDARPAPPRSAAEQLAANTAAVRAFARESAAPEPEPAERRAETRPAAERVLPAPTLTLGDIPPASGAALDSALLRGLADARAGSGAVNGGTAEGIEGGEPRLVDVEMLASPPQVLNRLQVRSTLSASYPPRLLFAGIEGEAVVAFIVGLDGRAEMENVAVLSATREEFVPAAMEGVRRMRFRPAKLNGEPVRVRVVQTLVWVLPPR